MGLVLLAVQGGQEAVLHGAEERHDRQDHMQAVAPGSVQRSCGAGT